MMRSLMTMDEDTTGSTVCNRDATKKATYENKCGVLKDEECFAACASHISPDEFYSSCLFDQCQTDGIEDAYFQAIEQYGRACQVINRPICDWTAKIGMVPECGANAHFVFDGPSCPATCSDPMAAKQCTKPNAAGCVCDSGHVLSGDECVPYMQCGC